MKNISQNKKGSTLVMVIIIFAILSILGTTLYSIAVTNGKIGIMTSKMKENFYFAESGLELAHSALIETIDEGIKQANGEANKALMGINLDTERGNEDSPYIQSDGNIDDNEIKKMQQNEFEKSYGFFSEEKYTGKPDIIRISKKLDSKLNEISTEKTNENNDEKYAIKAEYIKNNKKIDTVKLISTYTKNKITQSVSATYKLDDPEFSGIYSYESKIVEVPDEDMLKNAISTDRNLNIKSSNVNIKGNVFVNPQYKSESLSEEQSGNINVNNSNKLFMENGNIISKNMNVNNSTIEIDKLFTSDDLNIKERNNNITINDYFGYGDGDIQDKSSAIVIDSMNKEDNNFLKIKNELAILGTAFIDTLPEKYQTAESISIKKNYKAYSQEFANEKDELKYYSPLVLLDTDLGEKKERFLQKSSELNLGYNIIDIPKSSSAKGILLNNGNVIDKSISNVDKENIKKESDELMGDLKNGVLNRVENIQNLIDLDLQNENTKIKIEKGAIHISEETDFEGIMIASGSIAIDDNFNFKGILIAGGALKINGKSNIEGLIISGGEVSLYNNQVINGTIISGYDINFDKNSNINISSNENYIFKLLAQNENLTKNLFSNYKDVKKKKIRAYEKLVPSKESSYDINSIIKLDEWKVKYDEK